MRIIVIFIVLLMCTSLHAQSIPPAGDTGDVPADTHPIISTDATWGGSMVICITGLFLAALVVGPMVQAEKEDELPTTENGGRAHLTRHH